MDDSQLEIMERNICVGYVEAATYQEWARYTVPL